MAARVTISPLGSTEVEITVQTGEGISCKRRSRHEWDGESSATTSLEYRLTQMGVEFGQEFEFDEDFIKSFIAQSKKIHVLGVDHGELPYPSIAAPVNASDIYRSTESIEVAFAGAIEAVASYEEDAYLLKDTEEALKIAEESMKLAEVKWKCAVDATQLALSTSEGQESKICSVMEAYEKDARGAYHKAEKELEEAKSELLQVRRAITTKEDADCATEKVADLVDVLIIKSDICVNNKWLATRVESFYTFVSAKFSAFCRGRLYVESVGNVLANVSYVRAYFPYQIGDMTDGSFAMHGREYRCPKTGEHLGLKSSEYIYESGDGKSWAERAQTLKAKVNERQFTNMTPQTEELLAYAALAIKYSA